MVISSGFAADQGHRAHQQPHAIAARQLAHRVLQRTVALFFRLLAVGRRVGEQQRVLRRHDQFYPGIELFDLLFNLGQVIAHLIATAQLQQRNVSIPHDALSSFALRSTSLIFGWSRSPLIW